VDPVNRPALTAACDPPIRQEIVRLLNSVPTVDLETLYRTVQSVLGAESVRIAVELGRLVHRGIIAIDTAASTAANRAAAQDRPVIGLVRMVR
jgi:hypothetical protein